MDVSQRIATILKALGYTPATLAKSLDLSIYKARKILSGNYKITYGEFIKIMRLTGIEPNILLNGKEAL